MCHPNSSIASFHLVFNSYMTDEVYVLRKQGKKWKIPENRQENDKIL